jgi:hypothetical protein
MARIGMKKMVKGDRWIYASNPKSQKSSLLAKEYFFNLKHMNNK